MWLHFGVPVIQNERKGHICLQSSFAVRSQEKACILIYSGRFHESEDLEPQVPDKGCFLYSTISSCHPFPSFMKSSYRFFDQCLGGVFFLVKYPSTEVTTKSWPASMPIRYLIYDTLQDSIRSLGASTLARLTGTPEVHTFLRGLKKKKDLGFHAALSTWGLFHVSTTLWNQRSSRILGNIAMLLMTHPFLSGVFSEGFISLLPSTV